MTQSSDGNVIVRIFVKIFCVLSAVSLNAAAGPNASSSEPLVCNTFIGNTFRGEDVFKSRCRGCHTPNVLLAKVFEVFTAKDVVVFLQTHGSTNEQQDCDIVAYLRELAQEKP